MAKTNLTRVPTIELHRELERRAARRDDIEREQGRLKAELAAIDAEIAALAPVVKTGGTTIQRHRPRSAATHRRSRLNAALTRAANEMTLTQALRKVLDGTTMGVGEVAEAVQRIGYRTRAENFRTIVNLTLLRRKDLFKKRGRGKYIAK